MDNDRNELIQRRAYAIWEHEGRPEGRHDEHWRRAAEEMHGLEDAPANAKGKPVHLAPAGKKEALSGGRAA
jgi:hypothetical protein